ncbi:MAG: Mor transcription activator family protein [Clostridium sp.]|nr:Mor transcription activator family protein [Clostridium sp.]
MLERLTLEDLPDGQRYIAELIGLENYKKLVHYFGGSDIYIQKEDTLTKDIRNKEIISMFNGGNYLEIAKIFNLSERAVRQIILDNLKILGGEQITLFDKP